MLIFRDYEWLLVHGPTRFEVYIMANHQKPEDVMWSLELQYVEAGPKWRRVKEHERPQVNISLSSWHMESGNWLSLETMNFWDPDQVEAKYRDMSAFFMWPGGYVNVCFKPAPGAERERMWDLKGNWQVREREGGRFLVELAAHPGGMQMPPVEEKSLVLADGEEEKACDAERDPADFWKKNATIYLMERVPFGLVTVRVPRNVKDALAYARRRVKEMLGLSRAPEAYTMHDYLNYKRETPEDPPFSTGVHDDVLVKLHYHGYYEDR